MLRTWRDFVDEKVVRKNIDAIKQRLTDYNRCPSEADIAIIEERLRTILSVPLVVHCTKPATLEYIKRDGRLKSIFENVEKASLPAGKYPYSRESIRQLLFGKTVGQIQGLSQPDIIYAALLPSGSKETYGYGNARIILKDTVRQRATVTRVDTMEFNWEVAGYDPMVAAAAAVPLLEPSFVLKPFATLETAQTWETIADLMDGPYVYFEVQVHGGVTVDDIAEVQERISTDKPSDTIVSEEVKEWLQSKKIPFQIV
jgi:hypothetical protein